MRRKRNPTRGVSVGLSFILFGDLWMGNVVLAPAIIQGQTRLLI